MFYLLIDENPLLSLSSWDNRNHCYNSLKSYILNKYVFKKLFDACGSSLSTWLSAICHCINVKIMKKVTVKEIESRELSRVLYGQYLALAALNCIRKRLFIEFRIRDYVSNNAKRMPIAGNQSTVTFPVQNLRRYFIRALRPLHFRSHEGS